MTENEILSRVQKVYETVTGETSTVLTPDTKINRDKQVNSFVFMEFIMNLEEEFDIELSNSAVRSVKKVRNLIDIIQEEIEK